MIINKIITILIIMIFCYIITLTTINNVLSFEISEINYNPEGNDNNQEYVEFFVNKTHNFSLIMFGDSESNDSIIPNKINNSNSYWLFVEEGFNYSGLNCNVFSLGSTIGNNLDNTEDIIKIWYNGSLIINNSYIANGCSDGKGCSLSWNYSSNGSWINTNKTPCKTNLFPISNIINLTINETNIINNETNMSINVTLNITINTTINVTTNTTNNITTNITVNNSTNLTDNNQINCEFNLSIWSDKDVSNSGEQIKYKPIIICENSYDLSLSYWWEEVNGEEFKSKVLTKNTNQKTYTPKISIQEKILFIKMEATLNCSNKSQTAEKMIGIIGEKSKTNKESSPTISNSKTITEEKETLIVKVPENIIQNQSFYVNITLYNDGYLDQLFWVWGYLYENSKSYSGIRDKNMQEILIAPRTEENFKLKIDNLAPPKEIKLKIKAVKEGRKTPYEITKNIIVKKIEMTKIIQKPNNITQKIIQNHTIKNNVKQSHVKQNQITSNIIANEESWIKKNGYWGSIILAGLLWGITSIKKGNLFKQ